MKAWVAGGLLLALCTLPGLAAAQKAAPGGATLAALSADASPAASITEKMLAQVRDWVVKTQQLAPEQVQFAPLDARVQVQSCAQPLAIDFPFASRETVRVRCPVQPGWQLYLRVQTPSRAAPAGPAALPASGEQAPGLKGAQAAPSRTTVVARSQIQRGTLLQAGMLEEVTMPTQGLDPQAVSALQDLMFAETLRDVPAGSVLRTYDVRRAILVKRGQTVLLTASPRGDFQITIRVEAMQDGRFGDQINLKNTESGRFMSGTVTGPNAVRGL